MIAVTEIDSHQPVIPKDNSDITDILDIEDWGIEDEDETDVHRRPFCEMEKNDS